MAGYLQRFFEGPGAAAGLAGSGAVAPAHRPTSPLFTPDQQIAHAGFELGDLGPTAIPEEPMWPNAPLRTEPEPAARTSPRETGQSETDRRDRPSRDKSTTSPARARSKTDTDQSHSPQPPVAPSPAPRSEDPAASPSRAVPKQPPELPVPVIPFPVTSQNVETNRTEAAQDPAKPSKAAPAPKADAETRERSAEPESSSKPAVIETQTVPRPQRSTTIAPLSELPSPRTPQRAGEKPASPKARPVERAPEPLPQPTAAEPDWTSIERRVENLVREQVARQRPPQREMIVPPQSEADRGSTTPPRPMTAAEASVIGKIGAARRPLMIFGTRLR